MNKSFWIKLGVVSLLIALLITCLVIIKYQNDKIVDQSLQISEMKNIGKGIVRSETSNGSKDDIKDIAKKNNVDIDLIDDDAKKNNAEIKGINTSVSTSIGTNTTNNPSTSTTPKDDVEKSSDDALENHSKNTQTLQIFEILSDRTNVPFGDVSFSSWRDNPWDVNIHSRKYFLNTVLAETEDGKHYVYNKFTVTVDNKEYVIPIDKSSYKETKPERKFRFSPNLYLGMDIGVMVSDPHMEIQPNLQLALFSYGITSSKPDWTFVGVGVGYETIGKNASVMISPINYNIANHIPFVSNIFVGPAISVDTVGSFAIMGGVRVKM